MCINMHKVSGRTQSKGNQSSPGILHGKWSLLSGAHCGVCVLFYLHVVLYIVQFHRNKLLL